MTDPHRDLEAFVPTGAIAFFAVMVVVYAAFWAAMYLLLVQRG
jgi:hypothetical protein